MLGLHLPKGHFGALLGPLWNQEKSSLLRVIAGLDLPNHGSVWLNGKKMSRILPHNIEI